MQAHSQAHFIFFRTSKNKQSLPFSNAGHTHLEKIFILAKYCQVKNRLMKNIGDTLRALRESKGLLLREVGAELSLDPTLLSKIERNDRMPTKEQVKALSEFYEDKKNDKLVYEVQDEDLGLLAMKVAEKKIEYLKTQKS
jgi:ribosome-binding protein aMBF1 (putative translation factor)